MQALTYATLDAGQGGQVPGQQQGPTLRQRRLGSELKQLRVEAEVSQKDAGVAIDGNQSKVSKIETGRLHPRRLEVIALLDLYEVKDDTVRASILGLWRAAKQTQYLPEYDLRADMREMVDLEAASVRMEVFSTMHLPGLLQTPEYAAALIQGLEPTLEPERVQHYVDLRMARQTILDREDPPLVLCILDEGVLRRPIGGPTVMTEQLNRLLELSKRPNVTIQVVPFEQAVYPGLQGPFRTLVSEDNGLDVVEVSTWSKALYMQEPSEVETYRKLFDAIRSSALSSRQTADLINKAVREYSRMPEETE